MMSDPILLNLLSEILENPSDDRPRLDYADRLDSLGDQQSANRIRDQIKAPREATVVSGKKAGLPYVSSAVVRRGFCEVITIPRKHVQQLGQILQSHPIMDIYFDGIDDRINIEREVTPDSLVIWIARIGAMMAAKNCDNFFISDMIRSRTRSRMVDRIGEWADLQLPSGIQYPCFPAAILTP
jgi:uncharacterized protein (TIGR02996 family)